MSHSFLCYLVYTCTYTRTYTHALTHLYTHLHTCTYAPIHTLTHMRSHMPLPAWSSTQSGLSVGLALCLVMKWVLLIAEGFSFAKLNPKGMNVIQPNPIHP